MQLTNIYIDANGRQVQLPTTKHELQVLTWLERGPANLFQEDECRAWLAERAAVMRDNPMQDDECGAFQDVA